MALHEVHAAASLDALLDGPLAEPPPGPPVGRRPRRRRPVRTAIIVLLTTAAVLVAGVLSVALYVEHRLTTNLERIPGVFEGLPSRPAQPVTAEGREAVNLLFLGTDLRSDVPSTGDAAADWHPSDQRSDTMMLVHIDADRRGVTVVSLPRDSWVEVPGHGDAKINSAYFHGGPHLAVQAVEALTGVYVDHVAVVDWTGLAAITDAVGGVPVRIPETVRDTYHDVTWNAGEQVLNGEDALMYVRQRYGLPGGDLDRVRRQQAFLRSLLETSLHAEMRSDPRMLLEFLELVTDHVSVDSEWSIGEMRSLVFSLRHLRTADIRYLTAPVKGTGMLGAASVVLLDQRAGARLWDAMREDRLDAWVAAHPDALTSDVVR